MLSMKTALISLSTASLLAIAFVLSGRPFDAANVTALLFSTGLVAWTVSQYSRGLRPLSIARPIRLPAPMHKSISASRIHQLAA